VFKDTALQECFNKQTDGFFKLCECKIVVDGFWRLKRILLFLFDLNLKDNFSKHLFAPKMKNILCIRY
jgi:hypothetical protein